MMIKLTYTLATMLLLFAGLMNSSASAATLPTWYPDPSQFQNMGTVDRMARIQGVIVINDELYKLPSSVVVHTTSKQIDSLLSVREGKKVGITFTGGNSKHAASITEIWVLPTNYDLNTNGYNPGD